MAMAHTRLWEAAHRFREKSADYAAPTGKLDSLLYSNSNSAADPPPLFTRFSQGNGSIFSRAMRSASSAGVKPVSGHVEFPPQQMVNENDANEWGFVFAERDRPNTDSAERPATGSEAGVRTFAVFNGTSATGAPHEGRHARMMHHRLFELPLGHLLSNATSARYSAFRAFLTVRGRFNHAVCGDDCDIVVGISDGSVVSAVGRAERDDGRLGCRNVVRLGPGFDLLT